MKKKKVKAGDVITAAEQSANSAAEMTELFKKVVSSTVDCITVTNETLMGDRCRISEYIERLSNASRAMAAQYKKNEEMASKIKAIIEEN